MKIVIESETKRNSEFREMLSMSPKEKPLIKQINETCVIHNTILL